MSYDLMVFDPLAVPTEHDAFIAWYTQEMAREDVRSSVADLASPQLKALHAELIRTFPDMNGPDVNDDDLDENSYMTDFTFAPSYIYAAFAWSVAEEACDTVLALVRKHGVALFDVSSEEGTIYHPT